MCKAIFSLTVFICSSSVAWWSAMLKREVTRQKTDQQRNFNNGFIVFKYDQFQLQTFECSLVFLLIWEEVELRIFVFWTNQDILRRPLRLWEILMGIFFSDCHESKQWFDCVEKNWYIPNQNNGGFQPSVQHRFCFVSAVVRVCETLLWIFAHFVRHSLVWSLNVGWKGCNQ